MFLTICFYRRVWINGHYSQINDLLSLILALSFKHDLRELWIKNQYVYEYFSMIFRSIIEGSRIRPPGQFPRNSPLDNCFRTIPTQDNYPLDNCSTDNFNLGQLRPGQLPHEQLPAGQLSHRQVPPRTIAPRTIPQDNSHLWLLYCPPIITPGNYHREQWQLQITIFSWLFSVSFPWPNYIVSIMTKN